MRRYVKLSVIMLLALAAFSFGCVAGAFADGKPENTDILTVHTGWWGAGAELFADGAFEFDQTGQGQGTGCEAAANAADFTQNRFKFTVTVHEIDDGIAYYLFFDARGHSQAPWSPSASSVWVNLYRTKIETSFGDFNYAEGVDLADGEEHEIELIIDDLYKNVVLWIDDVSYSGTQESINEKGQFGYVCFGSKLTLASPSYGYTASSVTVTSENNVGQVKIGETLNLFAVCNPAEYVQTAVTWSSSDENIATVSEGGAVTGVFEGTAVIKAATAAGVAGEYEVTVVSEMVAPTGIALDKTAETLVKTQTLQLNATLAPAATNRGIVWTSSDESVATVDGNGLVTAVAGAGTATIRAASAADSSIYAECTIAAAPLNAASVDLPDTLKMEIGDAKAFSYSPVPADADDTFTVSVEDETVARYADGKLTALKEGETTVTVTSERDPLITATCAVSVCVSEMPEGMPVYPDYQKLTYKAGVDPSISQTFTETENGFVFDANNNQGYTAFPLDGNTPAKGYEMSAIVFAMKIETLYVTNDWCAAVLFRTSDPTAIFYSNPAGIGLRFYPDENGAAGRMEVWVHHGENATKIGGTSEVNPLDGLTHYYAIEADGTKITVWIDGVKAVDGYDAEELFGQYYNVAANNSFAVSARAKIAVSDLNIYNTALEEPKYTVTAFVVGKGTVTGIPEEAVAEGSTVTVIVTAEDGWFVKSVKVNGAETALENGALTVTVNRNTVIAVTFENENQVGEETPSPSEGEEGKKGCGGFAAYGSAYLAALALGAACLLSAKKRKR